MLILGLIMIDAFLPGGGGALPESLLTLGAIVLQLAFAVLLLACAERAVLGFGSLRPKFCSIYQRDFWEHERYWKVASTRYLRIFDGTPLKPFVWRLLGVPVGRRMFDDGLAIVEHTLVSIGDDSTFNMGSALQSHSLEDGTFKSDLIRVGSRCTVGTATLVNYGGTMEDGSTVDADSFLMKGSRVTAGAHWRGNPATEVAVRRDPITSEPENDRALEVQAL